MAALLLTGASQVLTLAGPVPRRRQSLRELGIVADGAVLIEGGRIAAVGPRRVVEGLASSRRARQLDVAGRVVLPGLIDSHTHLLFPASRLRDYELRLAGASYETIARAGGGILSTVRQLRRTSLAALRQAGQRWLRLFLAHGTTTLEAKTGYGLDLAGELKMLRVYRELARRQPVELVPTFLAHLVPPEYRAQPARYVEWLCQQMLPRVAAGAWARFCDVFCERGAFRVAQARRILTAARAVGLGLRVHANQLTRSGAARLAVELEAASADHLEHLDREDVERLARSNVVCTLLPGCSFFLQQPFAPARQLIDAGAIVALATDFNPGTSPTVNLPLILSLACSAMGLHPAEAIAAVTINAAYSLGCAHRVGSLEPGKQADLVVFDVADYREIPYYFGVQLCWLTIKCGRLVYRCPSAQRAMDFE